MLSFIVSTVVFLAAAIVLHRSLDNWGLDAGKGRTLIVLTIATAISYGAMALVDHFTGEPSLIDRVTKSMQADSSDTNP
jgi:hypothetical protein